MVYTQACILSKGQIMLIMPLPFVPSLQQLVALLKPCRLYTVSERTELNCQLPVHTVSVSNQNVFWTECHQATARAFLRVLYTKRTSVPFKRENFDLTGCAGALIASSSTQFWTCLDLVRTIDCDSVLLCSVRSLSTDLKANLHCFLQGVSIACYTELCISHNRVIRPSVCLSVCHTLELSRNYASYDHKIFTDG